ncbi:MAG: TetR/AcrR family transcriptional regulator [Corynebacterium sp.]|uniref:TetR/AcrR family transcriptional regulator n=1 Tax=Corynebacterium sp. TaxID=1720 RepID=UPI0026DB6D4C|nr:TetR/AcrR family transcriptional regulator [Corynebacterium sp.]MDO5030871.1 TetR/AcrR family transcriptional regulator [Corynebacterium sp.]
MSSSERRAQLLQIAAAEFAAKGPANANIDDIARQAGITQAYVFRIFGTKKALFLELLDYAFDRMADGLANAADGTTGIEAFDRMGPKYMSLLDDHDMLRLQLHGIASATDEEIRDRTRAGFAKIWSTIHRATGADDVAIKAFLGYGFLMTASTSLQLKEVDEDWSRSIRTPIYGGLFSQITDERNRPVEGE